MSEALDAEPANYASFNAFFTRALKPEVRTIDKDAGVLCCPVDGCISQLGKVHGDRLIQAKGRDYRLIDLLGNNSELANTFAHGEFATLYLSPRDYHRIHMPFDATLKYMSYIPGRLFSVAPYTTRLIPNLFARNERVVTVFNSDVGPLALILVGAINVAAIETVWHGLVTPPHRNKISEYSYTDQNIHLLKGQEMGRFNMGSTVILLTANPLNWPTTSQPGSAVRLGQKLAVVPSS